MDYMGLGPAVCLPCDMLADYHPNLETPERQGEWLCPKCGNHAEFGLWMFDLKRRQCIKDYTSLYKKFNNPAK